ncbi:MAG: SulP family inorganic anion transporter [Planctomycetota bacterium]|nr:MAG: SulP family inorganic anion transporter [Planctomycetota bacterium]
MDALSNRQKEEGWFNNLRGDLFGGLTAGVVALPLALGFGVASGLENGAAAGLYGAFAVGLLAAIFGGTPSQVSGPTGPMTVVVAGLTASLTGDPKWVFAMVALSGAFQMLFGALRIGRYVHYIPYPVVSGFMSGIGVIIIILQLAQLVGHTPEKSVVSAVRHIPHHFSNIHIAPLLLGLGTIAIIYLTPRITKAVPGTLVGLIVMSLLSVVLGLDVARIGKIPEGLPSLALPEWDWSQAQLIIVPAFVLAAVGSIDSLLTSLVADAMTKTNHDSEKELFGQGLGNLFSGLIGGLPGAGATMRTVVNIKSGGRGKLSGVVHSLFLLAVLLGLGPLAGQIPLSVLAGILITVGIGIVDLEGLKYVFRVPRGDAVVMLTVLVLTVFVDLLWAVGAGMVMASLILVKRLADMDPATHSPLKDLAAHRPWIPDLEQPGEAMQDVAVVEVHGSLFFGNAGPLRRKLGRAWGDRPAKALVLHLGDVQFIDQSGAYALRDLIEELQAHGTLVLLCELKKEPREVLERLKVAPGKIPAEHVVDTAEAAVAHAVAHVRENGSASAEGEAAPCSAASSPASESA